jgi:hypothetical protein
MSFDLLLLGKAGASGPAGSGSRIQDEIMADVPAFYYRLGETSGTVATDASGNARHGTYVNTPTLGVTGLVVGDTDKAATFSRASQEYVQTTYSPLHLSFSCEAIFKTTDSTNRKQIINQDDANTLRRFMFRIEGAKASMVVLDTDASATFVETGSYADGVAHHFVGTFTDSDRKVRLYIDGALIGTSGAMPGPVQSDALNIRVGADNWGAAPNLNAWEGTLDEVAYYSTVLSPARILAHYNAFKNL